MKNQKVPSSYFHQQIDQQYKVAHTQKIMKEEETLWTQEGQFKLKNPEADNYLPCFHGDCLYLIECYGQPIDKEPRMHLYSLKENTWKAMTVSVNKTKNGGFFPKPGMARTMVGPNLYCFGGIDNKGQFDNRISALNLGKRNWRPDLDLNTSNINVYVTPEARFNAILGSFHERFLILFGGQFSSTDSQNLNTLWIFDLEKFNWHKVSNLTIPSLSIFTFCMAEEKIYIYGHIKGMHSGQLFEIKIEASQEIDKFSLTFQKAEIFTTNPHKQDSPEVGVNYRMFPTKNKMILLFVTFNTGSKGKEITRLWIFDKYIKKWIPTHVEIKNEIKDIVEGEENIFYLIQRCQNSQTNIVKFRLSPSELKRIVDLVRFKQWKTCQICYEALINQNNLMQPAFKISKQMLDTLTQKISFPFAAFGIFAENSLNHSATYINFHYMNYKQCPMIKIEDDNRLNYTNEELEEVIVNFSAETNFNFGSVERRVRSLLLKDFLKKQFGTNLKIASMRLGSEMLYISITPGYEARVAYFTLQDDEYVCYYYAFDEKTDKAIDDYSLETKIYVESKFKELINLALHENVGALKYAQYKNTLYIMGLRTVESELGKGIPELQPIWSMDNIDILYISPNPMVYKTYLQFGCKINEAIDVSLVSYLSQLFIKNEHLKMTIQILASERKLIRRQETLEHVDKNALIKVVTAVDSSLKNFDLKSIDLMFNNKLNKKLGIFHNGILLYYRNRLIKRFGCELGDLLNNLEFAQKLSFGYFNVFGRIQLPDSLEVNQQKTDFLNQFMMEKLYSRLNVIHEVLLKSIDNDREETKQNHSKDGPKLRSRAGEEYNVRETPTKKVKRNQQDESYHGN